MAALFGAALVGFLLGVLLMILVVSGRRDEDLVERVERSEAEKRRTDREREAAHHLQPGVDGRGSTPAPARSNRSDRPGRPGRVDA